MKLGRNFKFERIQAREKAEENFKSDKNLKLKDKIISQEKIQA